MKHVIFIPNVDKGKGSTRHLNYHYSIESWKRWADKQDADITVVVMGDPIVDPELMSVAWQRYHLFNLLDQSGIEYDSILMVDADTIVHPDTPNFFEMTDGKYVGVLDLGCWNWTGRSIELYADVFNGFKLDRGYYINGGFQIVNKSHMEFFDLMLNTYKENHQLFLKCESYKLGTDQTPLNYMLQIHNVDRKILPPTFNLHHMFSKNLLFFGQQWMEDSLKYLYNQGWVYHFNAIPQNPLKRDTNYYLERAYKELWGELT